MLGRVISWTTKFLSNAGRLQLIKSVLTDVQSFWAQIFPLPKTGLHKIKTICRRFLWTWEVDTKKKAMVAWEKVCLPKSAGGLNVTDMLIWNKAVLIKHLWNICKKKERLWIL